MGEGKSKIMLFIITISLIVSIIVLPGTFVNAQSNGSSGSTLGTSYTDHPVIRVNNNADLAALRSSGGCTGSGTIADPFTISGYNITGVNGACIFIGNTTSYVTVKNCYLHGAGYVDDPFTFGGGVSLFNVQNATLIHLRGMTNGVLVSLFSSNNNTIVNNDCSHNDMGMFFKQSNHNIIENNTCKNNNGVGIYLFASNSNNALKNNTCMNNGASGIYLKSYSCNNLVQDNICTFNSGNQYGILVDFFSNNNMIRKNNCSNNQQYGIMLMQSTGNVAENNICNHNSVEGIELYFTWSTIVRNNSCSYNGDNGIEMLGYWSNIIENNTCFHNVNYGLYLTETNNNLIVNNNLIGNRGATAMYSVSHMQAFDDGTNKWNSTNHGNYWSDWTAPDANLDGIVDQPYLIDGGADQDNYPTSTATTPLTANIISPREGSFGNATTIQVSWEGTSIIMYYNVSIDGGSNINVSMANSHIFGPLSDGTHHVILDAFDIFGNNVTAQVNFTVDSVRPGLTINSPGNNTYNKTGSVLVVWHGSDDRSGISHYTIGLDGRTAVQLTAGTTSYICNGLGEGNYTVRVTAFDKAGNSFAASTNFMVTFGPKVHLAPPSPIYTNQSTVTGVTLNVTDLVPFIGGNSTYYLNGTLVSYYSIDTLLAGHKAYQEAGPRTVDLGTNVWYYTINDSAGCTVRFNLTVIYDTGTPTISITSPNDGVFISTTTVDVTWAANAPSGIQSYQYSLDLASWSSLSPALGHVFTGLSQGLHTVEVRAVSNAGNRAVAAVQFTVDSIAPTVGITSPVSSYSNTTSVSAAWSGSDAGTGLAGYQYRLDGLPWSLKAIGTSVVLGDLGQGQHFFTVKAWDLANNSATSSINFTVDSIAPTVHITSPVEGLITNSSSMTVTWTGNDSGSGMDHYLVSTDGITFSDIAYLNGTWTYGHLADGVRTIYVRGIDKAGNVGGTSANITIDSIAPSLTAHTPSGNEIAVNAVLSVTFSEAMNASSFKATINAAAAIGSWTGNMVVFGPSSGLAYNTTYTIAVTGKDIAGNQVNFEWSFKTSDKGTIEGVLKDPSGNPIVNATVTLSNGMTVLSDGTGHYSFTNVTAGSYTLTISGDGYRTTIETVSVTAGLTKVIDSPLSAQGSASAGPDNTVMMVVAVGLFVVLLVGFVIYRRRKV